MELYKRKKEKVTKSTLNGKIGGITKKQWGEFGKNWKVSESKVKKENHIFG